MISSILSLIVLAWYGPQGADCYLNDTFQRHRDVDVLVLGAGLSGSGAAIKLHELGIKNFLVLEAKNYIGGRLREVEYHGQTIAKGAGWIHKIETNHRMYQLAKKYNLKTAVDSYDFDKIAWRHGVFGYRFNKWYVNNNDKELKEGLKKCIKYCEKTERKGVTSMTLRECLEHGGWDIKDIHKEKLRESIDFYMFDFENAGKAEKMSAWQMSYTGEGKDLVVIDHRGYNYPLLQEIKSFRHLFKLNSEIKSVLSSGNRHTVTTTDGRTFRAKHVIVSFSSGVLQSQNVLFSPPLPPWKMDALKFVPMGHYCKYFFKFPYQFWEDITYILLGTKKRGNYAHWQNMNQAHLLPGSNIMLCTLTGDICKEKDGLDDATIIKEAMAILRIQVEYKNAPDPIDIYRSHWSSDPHFLGAYSLPSPGVTPKHYDALEHPINKGVWFTGEYASLEDFGYTHGALMHGEKIAERVVKCLKHGICPGERPY